MSFDLYLIRHGESTNNALPESQRVEDPGLTEEGIRQANCMAQRFSPGSLTNLLTSGFRRAIQTTLPLADHVQCRPKIWTDLHEVGGCYAGHIPGEEQGRPGMSRDTLERDFPSFDLPDDIDEHGWWKSKPYETWDQARSRAAEQSQRLARDFLNTDARVGCVIHADFKAILLEALVPSMSEHLPADLHNTGITHLRHDGKCLAVLDFNNVDHLNL